MRRTTWEYAMRIHSAFPLDKSWEMGYIYRCNGRGKPTGQSEYQQSADGNRNRRDAFPTQCKSNLIVERMSPMF